MWLVCHKNLVQISKWYFKEQLKGVSLRKTMSKKSVTSHKKGTAFALGAIVENYLRD